MNRSKIIKLANELNFRRRRSNGFIAELAQGQNCWIFTNDKEWYKKYVPSLEQQLVGFDAIEDILSDNHPKIPLLIDYSVLNALAAEISKFELDLSKLEALKELCVNRAYLHNLGDSVQADVSMLGEEGEEPVTTPGDVYRIKNIFSALIDILYDQKKEQVKIFEIDAGNEYLFACAKRESDLVLLRDWTVKEIPEDLWHEYEMMDEAEEGTKMITFKEYIETVRGSGVYGVFSRSMD